MRRFEAGNRLRDFFAVAGILVAGAIAAGSAHAAGEMPRRILVHVRLPELSAVVRLQAAGFDVSGINRPEGTAGVPASDDDLTRLAALGWSYDVDLGASSDESILALQDYTDPAEMNTFVDQVVTAYPNLVQKVVLANNLFEGHLQYALKITKDVSLPNLR